MITGGNINACDDACSSETLSKTNKQIFRKSSPEGKPCICIFPKFLSLMHQLTTFAGSREAISSFCCSSLFLNDSKLLGWFGLHC